MSGIVLAAVILLSLLGAGMLMLAPGSTQVEAREDTTICQMVPVALDDGYSISRIEMRQVCGHNR